MNAQQRYARRIERAACKEEATTDDDFGPCSLCGFVHLHPLERGECPVCGLTTCFGNPGDCGCAADGKLEGATEKAGYALAGVPAGGRSHVHAPGGDPHEG